MKVSLAAFVPFWLSHVKLTVVIALQLFHEDGECWVYDEPLLKRLAASKH